VKLTNILDTSIQVILGQLTIKPRINMHVIVDIDINEFSFKISNIFTEGVPSWIQGTLPFLQENYANLYLCDKIKMKS